MRRGSVEYIGVLVVVTAVIAASLIYYTYASKLVSREPEVKSLDARVASVTPVSSGAKAVYITSPISPDFNANYIYRVTITIFNSGSVGVHNLNYQVVDLDPNDGVSICTSDSCQIYDPIALAQMYTTLPTEVPPNGVVSLDLTVLSKVEIRGHAYFAIKITGVTDDGVTVSDYAVIK
jgi:hypothetical protein